MRLFLVRHGATANNVEQRYTGQSDIPLSEFGERQVEALARRLAEQHFDTLVSSDLQRAYATAERIARGRHQEIHADRALREIDMGDWQGRTPAEVASTGGEALARWQADPIHCAPPGGETIAAVRDRLAQALATWQHRYPDGNVLWVTHGGVIGILLCHVLGMDLNRRWQFRRDNASITELEVGVDYAVIYLVNDTHHLASLPTPEAVEARQIL